MKRLRTVNRRGRQAEQRAARSRAAENEADSAETKGAAPRPKKNSVQG